MNLHRKPIGGFIRVLLCKRNRGQFNWNQQRRWETVEEGGEAEGRGGKLRFISAFPPILPDVEEIRGGGKGRDILKMCSKNRIILLRTSVFVPFLSFLHC